MAEPQSRSTGSRWCRSTTVRSCSTGSCPPKQANKLLKALRTDLVGLEAEEFVSIWEGADVTSDWPF